MPWAHNDERPEQQIRDNGIGRTLITGTAGWAPAGQQRVGKMQADVNPGDGSEADAADGATPEEATSETGAAHESAQGDRSPGSGSALEHSRASMLADYDRYARPLLNQTQALRPLFESASRLMQQAQSAESFARWTERLDETIRRLHVPLSPPAEFAMANLMAANLRGFDQLAGASERHTTYAATARWAERLFSNSALASWRISLEANAHLEQLSKSLAAAIRYSTIWEELLRVGRVQAAFTDWVVQQDATSRLLGEVSNVPLARWRDYLDGLAPELSVGQLRASGLSGYTTLGIISADVLISGAEDADLVDASVSRIETDVLHPWEEARLELARDLYARLGAIDSSVPALLDGAWDDLKRNGPAAVEKVAHCIVEVLDRTLRAAAPDDAVREWHAREGRSEKEWEGQDRPPRSLRVRFLAQRLGGERGVAVAEYESLIQLRKRLTERLQAVKHASQGDLVAVRNLLLGTEYLLTMLFVSGD